MQLFLSFQFRFSIISGVPGVLRARADGAYLRCPGCGLLPVFPRAEGRGGETGGAAQWQEGRGHRRWGERRQQTQHDSGADIASSRLLLM